MIIARTRLGLDEVSTMVRRSLDKDYLTFWRHWREFADKLVRKGITHTETRHCDANTEAYTLTGNGTYGNETLRHTTIQKLYTIYIAAHSTMVIQRKGCGLGKPTTRTLCGYEHRCSKYTGNLSTLPTLPTLPSILPTLLSIPTFYPTYPIFYPAYSICYPNLSAISLL